LFQFFFDDFPIPGFHILGVVSRLHYVECKLTDLRVRIKANCFVG